MNETRTTTTAAQVYRLEADNRAAHHSRRTQAAQARHQVNTAGTWTATPEGIRPPIHRQSGAQLLRTADTATFLALRARHASSGLDLFAQLTRAAKADQGHRAIEATAAQALEAERERDTRGENPRQGIGTPTSRSAPIYTQRNFKKGFRSWKKEKTGKMAIIKIKKYEKYRSCENNHPCNSNPRDSGRKAKGEPNALTL